MADICQVDFNGRHALRVSVSPMMYASDVAECLQVLADGFMKAAEVFLLGQGALKPNQQTEMSLKFILCKRRRC